MTARDEVKAVLIEGGATEEWAESALREMHRRCVGWHDVEPEPVAWTGEKAAEETKERALAQMRAQLRGAGE